MNEYLKRTWAQVSLDNIGHNYKAIKEKVGDTMVMAMVKADGYGHGAPAVSLFLEKCGVTYFGVSNFDEAMQLYRAGVSKNILILGYTPIEYVGELIERRFIQSVYSKDYAESISGAAKRLNGEVRIHIKIDTGMSRYGFVCHSEQEITDCAEAAAYSALLPNLHSEGIFTHFAESDNLSSDFTKKQFGLFLKVIEAIEKRGIKFKVRHCSNSAAIMNFPEMNLDMVRPGVILYGMLPSEDTKDIFNLKPVMTLKSVISQVKEIDEGATVSYGRTFTAENKRRVAVIPIGYADGYMRALSGKAFVVIRGKRAKLLGRICMDICMADITETEGVSPGEEVIIFGESEGERVLVDELAAICDTINYEITCVVGKRVPRIYIENSKEAGVLNYIDNITK
jgi:alanine racemase